MRYRLLQASDATSDVWSELTALQKATPGRADPMLNPELAQVLSGIRPDTHIALCEDDDGIAAAWPLHLHAGNWARPLGGPFSDWHAPLIRGGVDVTSQGLLAGCEISGMTVFGYAPRPGEACVAGERVGAHLTILPGDGQTAIAEIANRFPKHAKKMRRVRRNMEHDHSEIDIVLDDRRRESFDQIVSIKRAQFANTGRHDVLASDWASRYFDALRQHQAADLHIRVSTLFLDGRLAAGEINLCSSSVVHGWLTAFDRDYSVYSPGYLITEDIHKDMPSRGQHIYSAGCGLDHYKKYSSNAMAPLDRGVIRGSSNRPTSHQLLSAGWHGLETALPGRVGQIMGKVRRRSDQILTSEIDTAGRARGFVNALGL